MSNSRAIPPAAALAMILGTAFAVPPGTVLLAAGVVPGPSGAGDADSVVVATVGTIAPVLVRSSRRMPAGSPTIVVLGSLATPHLRAVLRILDSRHPRRLYTLGLLPRQNGTLFSHTRADKTTVLANPQPGAIRTAAQLQMALRQARPVVPQGRRRKAGGRRALSLPEGATPEDTTQLPASVPPTASIDLTRVPPVRDQGEEGSCSGWSSSYYYKTFQEARRNHWDVRDPHHQFSPAFVYNQINGGKDEGAYMGDALRLIHQKGDVTWAAFPYQDGSYRQKPSPALLATAAAYRSQGFRYLFFAGKTGPIDLTRLKRWLARGDGFLLGIGVTDSFANYTGGVFDDQSTEFTDHHFLFVVGYDDNAEGSGMGAFHVVNSFGTGWGEDGYGWISYDAVTRAAAAVFTMHVAGPTGLPATPLHPASPVLHAGGSRGGIHHAGHRSGSGHETTNVGSDTGAGGGTGVIEMGAKKPE